MYFKQSRFIEMDVLMAGPLLCKAGKNIVKSNFVDACNLL